MLGAELVQMVIFVEVGGHEKMLVFPLARVDQNIYLCTPVIMNSS